MRAAFLAFCDAAHVITRATRAVDVVAEPDRDDVRRTVGTHRRQRREVVLARGTRGASSDNESGSSDTSLGRDRVEDVHPRRLERRVQRGEQTGDDGPDEDQHDDARVERQLR